MSHGSTPSALNWDWGWEGKPGMSTWVLLRSPIPDADNNFLQSDTDFTTYWASPDGTVSADDDARKSDSRQLIHFENNLQLQSELVFNLGGKRHRYTRPSRNAK